MAPPTKKVRGPSAYMVFTDEHRREVQERLKQESENGKVAAPAIAKALGEVWKGMSEEDKDVYRQKSKERAEAAAAAAAEETAAAAAAGDQEQQDGDAAAAGDDASAQAAAAAIPKHIVKRIMLADDEVQRVSADALWLVSEAGRLFLQQLAVKGAAAAATKKRRTIKLEDFEQVVRCDKRLVAAGLKDVVSNRRLFEAHGIAAALGGSGAAGRTPRSKAAAAAASKGGSVAAGQQQQEGAELGTAGVADAAADGDDQQQQQGQTDEEQQLLTDEERIALEEAQRQKAAEAAKARAAKAAERKVAKAAEVAKDTHKITTFFVSNKPDAFV